jgi:hypothetical protein
MYMYSNLLSALVFSQTVIYYCIIRMAFQLVVRVRASGLRVIGPEVQTNPALRSLALTLIRAPTWQEISTATLAVRMYVD